MLEHINRGGLDMLIAGQLEKHGFLVAFSSRQGGDSVGDHAGLNLSYNVGDDPRAVHSNRELLASALGVPVEKWVLPQQVHGCAVNEVGVGEVGRGALDFGSGISGTDGLVTSISGVALGVLTADCLPVVLVAKKGRAVAVAHAGWRGVLGGITIVAARKLAAFCSSSTAELYAFIGPHIRSCCMEVDEDVAELFKDRFEGTVVQPSTESKWSIDLELACRQQLAGAGLIERNVFNAGVCTVCHPGYFSYRGSGGTCGRQGALVAVVDNSGGS